MIATKSKENSEVFLPIPNYESLYLVSNKGSVMTLQNSALLKAGSLLSPAINRQGYRYVILHNNGCSKSRTVHSLVAETFLGTRKEGMQVNHIDGVKTNNNVENLEYVTQSENLKHAFRLGLSKARPQHGSHNGYAKLTEEQVLEMREARRKGERYKAIAERYGVHPNTVQKVCSGYRWGHLKD